MIFMHAGDDRQTGCRWDCQAQGCGAWMSGPEPGAVAHAGETGHTVICYRAGTGPDAYDHWSRVIYPGMRGAGR